MTVFSLKGVGMVQEDEFSRLQNANVLLTAQCKMHLVSARCGPNQTRHEINIEKTGWKSLHAIEMVHRANFA